MFLAHPRFILLRRLSLSLTLLTLFHFFSNTAQAQDGKALFQTNCASCHAVKKDLTGPALAGAEERVGDKKILHDWIRNNSKVLASGNPYFTALFQKWNKTAMNTFPSISDADIDAILKYVKEEASKTKTEVSATAGTEIAKEEDNTILYTVVLIVLALIVLMLARVNNYLKKAAKLKLKESFSAPIPFYRNKLVIALGVAILIIVAGIVVAKWGIGQGRQTRYQPKQPIFYSHKVHAGLNQINCLYCHGGAEKSKHASIPSVNVCMNCHMAITEYTGPQLFNLEGEAINGTEEIKKLHQHAGFEKGKPWTAATSGGNNIEWVRVHNLPDHVYFSHEQHTRLGKVQCQTCHGPIETMDEVYQHNDLSMGWCVNCHRTTKVNFKDNQFYSMYEQLHKDLKEGKMSEVHVDQIGGIECQKCHY